MDSEIFTSMKIQVEVFWIVTPCCDVVGYHRFEDLSGSIVRVKMEAEWPRRYNLELYDFNSEEYAF
jgi:hypothetical protein